MPIFGTSVLRDSYCQLLTERVWVLFCLSSRINTNDQKTSEANQWLQRCPGGTAISSSL